MPTFIDESGDTGHNPAPNNCYFRLAAVWLPTLKGVEAFRERIRAVRRGLGVGPNYEFKFAWTGARLNRRAAFFDAALEGSFRFAVSSIDKRLEPWADARSEVMHWASAVSLAAALRPTYRAEEAARGQSTDRPLNEVVIVDDNRDKHFLRIVTEKFRELASTLGPGAPLVGKVKFRGSGPDELIQLADMVCGAVGAHLDGDSTSYRQIASRDLGTICIP